MKSISASATLISLFLGLAVVAPTQAADYYIYHDPDGRLTISNKKPPPGSKIIRQRDLPEFSKTQAARTSSGPNEASAGTRSE